MSAYMYHAMGLSWEGIRMLLFAGGRPCEVSHEFSLYFAF
jgi:hypothetical protein